MASTVGTSTSNMSVWVHWQRKCLYVNGRFWVFYSDGTSIVFRTSTDGSSWSDATTVRAGTSGHMFSICHDGSYLHYAYTASGAGAHLYYRMGTLNANGTITWAAAEQDVTTGDGIGTGDPSICVDSSGYPWMSYHNTYGDGKGTNYYIIKSSTKNGTWTTADGFPEKWDSGWVWEEWFNTVIPLASGKMYHIYLDPGAVIKAYLWDGNSWGNSENVSSSNWKTGTYVSVVSDGDVIHLVFTTDGDVIKYIKYTHGSGWSAEETVQSWEDCAVLALDTANDELYCFWAGSPTADHIYYKKRTSGGWDADPTDWIDETADDLTDAKYLTCFLKDYSSKIGLAYSTKTESPYNVRFDFLTVGAPPVVGPFPTHFRV